MSTDRLAKHTFRIGNQACPIDYGFINNCFFGEVLDYGVEHIEGSDHWPLRLTIRSANKKEKEKEKALIAQVDYPHSKTTRLTESSLKALNELIVNYPSFRMEEDPKDMFKGIIGVFR
ncbi:hypothetical protein NDU88_002483 [Pleurodeles waltl]|uniref:Uncharacterized protein n=1 Tax=Pleurodeles waltl TaxID=8319 RepID=A0AAV7W361_PLEWA|nr:hypothetical protein NDU88_002483 [Pleurodeles waltl]